MPRPTGGSCLMFEPAETSYYEDGLYFVPVFTVYGDRESSFVREKTKHKAIEQFVISLSKKRKTQGIINTCG